MYGTYTHSIHKNFLLYCVYVQRNDEMGRHLYTEDVNISNTKHLQWVSTPNIYNQFHNSTNTNLLLFCYASISCVAYSQSNDPKFFPFNSKNVLQTFSLAIFLIFYHSNWIFWDYFNTFITLGSFTFILLHHQTYHFIFAWS